MDESWKNCFEEELLCPICLNVFEEPIQLPCKHNFCRGCISEAWAKEAAAVRCPECNHEYEQKPALEKNIKLANIVEQFNALNTEKVPAVLHCVLCRRGPPLPVQKVCLRCKEPCCQAHIQTHLQQPCSAPGHLFVDVGELRGWTCPKHEEYRLFHCEDEQLALCPFCCISRCSSQRHTVCDVETQRTLMQTMLMRQQERLDGRVQNIDEQLSKLESDKTMMKDAVCDLKERVRAQYQRMHALLEADLSETMQLLDSAHSLHRQKRSRRALQLRERRQEADKLLSSAHMFFQRAENMNFMKNTKPYQLLMDRSNSHLGSSLPPHRVGQLNSHHFLSELSTREQNLRKMLEEPFSESPILQTVLSHSGCTGSSTAAGPRTEKRKYGTAFPDSKPGPSTSQDLAPSSKEQSHRGSSLYPSGGLSSQTPHTGPNPSQGLGSSGHHMVGLGSSSSSHHSGTVFSPSHFPSGGQYEGRKVLMCTLDNCCCPGASPSGHPAYPAPNSFPWIPSQEFTPHAPLSSGQALQGLSMRGLMDASQTARTPGYYGLYGQSSAKHYVTS